MVCGGLGCGGNSPGFSASVMSTGQQVVILGRSQRLSQTPGFTGCLGSLDIWSRLLPSICRDFTSLPLINIDLTDWWAYNVNNCFLYPTRQHRANTTHIQGVSSKYSARRVDTDGSGFKKSFVHPFLRNPSGLWGAGTVIQRRLRSNLNDSPSHAKTSPRRLRLGPDCCGIM